MYLTLGANPYHGVVRYKINDDIGIFLGSITFKYGAKYENCGFYIPPEYEQIIQINKFEMSLLDLHKRFIPEELNW